jgi:chromosome segregation ATPase
MSEEELRSQILKIQSEITKLLESTHKKEAYITNRCNEEFDPKLNQMESQLKSEQGKLEEATKRMDQWISKKKELDLIVKDLTKNYNRLKNEKDKYLAGQLKAIAKEKKSKIKALNAEIKDLEKKLKNIGKD